jgi:oligopeptide/dipeptide ABC transporter ATP-binding protein
MSEKPYLVEVRDLRKYYPIPRPHPFAGRRYVKAVDGCSFGIREGEIFGLVGESGCGKSTTGRMAAGLEIPTAGSVNFSGFPVAGAGREEARVMRRSMQIVFQDPAGALNPRMRVGTILEEPLRIQRIGNRDERRERVAEMLDLVGLDGSLLGRYPRELSGGQRQRVVIGAALMLDPRFLVADEPVSALDVSVQSQILNLLMELRGKLGLTMLFISHNLDVVRYVSDRVAVMYLGRIVETASVGDLFDSPLHPYTRALMSAIPGPAGASGSSGSGRAGGRVVLRGDPPNPAEVPSGCPFHPRCPKAADLCAVKVPESERVGNHGSGRFVRCFFPG